jgi:hypothetical protein
MMNLIKVPKIKANIIHACNQLCFLGITVFRFSFLERKTLCEYSSDHLSKTLFMEQRGVSPADYNKHMLKRERVQTTNKG